MKYVQVKLKRGNTVTTCWVENDPRLAVGKFVVLLDEEGSWKIEKLYKGSLLDKPPHQPWKVGGLT
jgi:hypothetical protein